MKLQLGGLNQVPDNQKENLYDRIRREAKERQQAARAEKNRLRIFNGEDKEDEQDELGKRLGR